MFKWLLPKETSFFDFFEAHGDVLVRSAQKLCDLFAEGTNIPAHAAEIKELEHEADQITHSCVEALHLTFLTPFERNDILRLISQLDDIVDLIENIASRCMIYRINTTNGDVQKQARLLFRATLEIQQALKILRNPREVEPLRHLFSNVNALEHEADDVYREALGRLFSEETDARELIKWKEIYEEMEDAIDGCEDVVNIIEGVVLES